MNLKNYLFLFCLLIISSLKVSGNSVSETLARGDSLFEARNYTAALEVYEQILKEGHYSRQMINRLSFISQGLEAPDKTMYYLSILNRYHPSELLENKMSVLAEENKLKGYEFKEIAYLITYFKRHKETIVEALVMACIGFAILIVIVAFTRFGVPSAMHVLYFILVFIAFGVLNLRIEQDYLIAQHNNSFIRAAPSSAAQILTRVKKGDRLKLKKYDEHWSEVLIDDQIGFIRSSHCLSVR